MKHEIDTAKFEYKTLMGFDLGYDFWRNLGDIEAYQLLAAGWTEFSDGYWQVWKHGNSDYPDGYLTMRAFYRQKQS